VIIFLTIATVRVYAGFRFADFQGYVDEMCYLHLIQVKADGPVFFFFNSE
jgi:hypothetical protein